MDQDLDIISPNIQSLEISVEETGKQPNLY